MTSKYPIKVGSRASPLAKAQVREVAGLLRRAGIRRTFATEYFATSGDVDKATSLLASPADNFFTDALDCALLAGAIDVAVHSAKDLPRQIPAGLKIFALTKALDETDALVGRAAHSQLPAGSRVGTSSALRKEQILRGNPALKIVDVRGTIAERLKLLDDGKLDALIVATCALKRLGLARRIKEILPWEGTPLQGQLAVVGRAGDRELEKIFAEIDVRQKYGKVFLVGAGPGDPELISVKGVNALKNADCVFYDYLVSRQLLDYALSAEKIDAGKRKGACSLPQSELSRQLRQKAQAGKTVVRLKGGDPLIFGRGADEIEYLRSYHINVQVVPGVTSATGIPSALSLPLTARGISSSVAFVSGHGEDEKHPNPAPPRIPDAQTLVFLMALTKLPQIVQALLGKGWPKTTPAAVISQGTRPEQKIVLGTLADIAQKVRAEKIAQPALIIVGETVRLYRPGRPEEGAVLYLGTYPDKYKLLGRIIPFPMIAISAAHIDKPKVFLRDLDRADTVLLTSRCAVKYFFEFLVKHRYDLDRLRVKDLVVIGKDTQAQLNMFGFAARLTADDETSEGLLKKMKKYLTLKGRRVIFPRSSLSNPYLKARLTKAGAAVKEWAVYENSKPPKRPLPDEKISGVIFTSPSTVNNFFADYGQIPPGWRVFAKGRPTSKALSARGIDSEILVTR